MSIDSRSKPTNNDDHVAHGRGDPPVPVLAHNELDYARGAVVGAVVVDRRGSADGPRMMAINLQRIAPLFRAGLVMTCLGAVVASGAIAAKFGFARQFSSAEFFWIVGAMAGLGWIITGLKQMLDSRRSRTIEITPTALSLLFRQDRSVLRAEVPREAIADVLILPIQGFLGLLSPRGRRVHAALTSGERIELHVGTHEEAKFLRSVLAAELRLPDEQWVDAIPADISYLSRLKIRMDACGVQVHQPARATWFLLLLTAILTPSMPIVVAWISTLTGRSWHNVWERDTAPLLSGVLTLVVGLAICAIVYHFRRESTVTITQTTLVLSEAHPFRPALSEWQINTIDSFAVRDARGSAAIDVIFNDGAQAAPLLERLRRRDLARAHEALQVGLQRARKASDD